MNRTIFLFIVVAPLFAVGCAGDPEPDPNAPPPRLKLELQAETPVITLGKTPKFVAHLVNEGDKPVTIVLPGDGSSMGWRTPVVRWKPDVDRNRKCGNINSLKADEVITLVAGQKIRLSGWIDVPKLSEAGKHAVTLEIENIPDIEWRDEPHHNAAAMARVKRSPRFKVQSNVVEVEVQP